MEARRKSVNESVMSQVPEHASDLDTVFYCGLPDRLVALHRHHPTHRSKATLACVGRPIRTLQRLTDA